LSYLGLTVLLIGVVCLAVGEVNLANVKTDTIGTGYSVWSYACNLTRGNTYGVNIESGDDWSLPFSSGAYSTPMPVNVSITSPENDTTLLQAFFYGEMRQGMYNEGTPPSIVTVEYLNVDYAGLTVDYLASEIRFTPHHSGPYAVSVLQPGLWSTQPPSYILFYELVAPNSETYSLLAAGGGIMGTVGGITFIVTLFKSRGTKHRRTHR
jgi:hypothetical protein